MIKIDLDDRSVLNALNGLLRAGADLQPALQDIGEYLVVSTRDRFRDGVAPDGAPWAPNSPVTTARRGKGAAGKRPLIGETRQLSTRIFYRVTAHTVEVGSPLEYAAVHQFGAGKGQFGRSKRGSKRGPIPWGDIPARPFLGLSDQDRSEVLDIIQEHLARALGAGD